MKDADIYYEVYGKGKPLFLLHGNGGSIGAFSKEIPNSQLKIFDGASHGVPVERAEELSKDVMWFIKN